MSLLHWLASKKKKKKKKNKKKKKKKVLSLSLSLSLSLPSSKQPREPYQQHRHQGSHEQRQQTHAQAPALPRASRHGSKLATGSPQPRSRRSDVVVETFEQPGLQLELLSHRQRHVLGRLDRPLEALQLPVLPLDGPALDVEQRDGVEWRGLGRLARPLPLLLLLLPLQVLSLRLRSRRRRSSVRPLRRPAQLRQQGLPIGFQRRNGVEPAVPLGLGDDLLP